MEHHGGVDEILPRYRAAFEAERDSPRHGYLYARLLPHAEGLEIAGPLLAAHPEDPWLRRTVAWSHYHLGRFEQALPHYEVLLTLVPEEAGSLHPFLARCRVALGRPVDALVAVSEFLDGISERRARGEDIVAGGSLSTLLILYARLQTLVPRDRRGPSLAECWRRIVLQDADSKVLAGIAAAARDTRRMNDHRPSIRDADFLHACDLTLISRTDVQKAARMALGTADELLAGLDDLAQVAIAAELVRQGHRDKARGLLEMLSAEAAGIGMAELDSLPEVAWLRDDLDLDLQAALLYAASRRTDDTGTRDALRKKARRLDVLGMALPDPDSRGD